MAEIEGLVRALREGDDAAKAWAARALGDLAFAYANDANAAKAWAARALGDLAYANDANRVLIAEAGGVPPLVHLLRVGSAEVKSAAAMALANVAPVRRIAGRGALFCLARNNDANAVAIAVAVGFDALVELARGGRVTVNNRSVMRNAGVAAKRKAALVVAKLLRDRVPEFKSAPGDIKAAIALFL
ncbi:ubiquitin-protein transferase [Aureococcus anophagefferens]|nr:ubiquitin-protein transferase [Aureococcus anophagefferens]